MARLPKPGSDDGTWGDILNNFLSVEHNADGSLKNVARPNDINNASVADGSITTSKLADNAVTNTKLDAATQSSISKANSAVQSVNSKTPTSGALTLTATDVAAIPAAQKGAASGVATLESNSTLTPAQLPASVVTKSTNSADTGKAIDAYTGAPLTIAAGGQLTPTDVKTADYTAAAGELVRVDTSTSSREVYDLNISSGSTAISSATANFTSADIGKAVMGNGIGTASTPATIVSVLSSTQATLSASASANSTSTTATIGSGGVKVTLPASAAAGAIVAVKKLDSAAKPVNIVPSAGDTIDGLTQATIGTQYMTREFIKNSANIWVVQSGYTPLSKGGASTFRPGTVINWIGDSIAPPQAQAGTTRAMTGSATNSDYLWWAHLLSNAKLLYGRPSGIGSQRADMMVQRIYIDTLSEGGHFCGIQTGTNDASAGRTVQQYATDIRTMCDAIVAAGQTPILTSAVPVNNSSYRVIMDQYRRFTQAYAIQNGWPFVDFFSVLSNGSTGIYNPSYDSGDGVHPNAAGKQAMGQAIADALSNWVTPTAIPLVQSNLTTDSASLINNGLFLLDSNSDGIPDGWGAKNPSGSSAVYSINSSPGGSVLGSAFRVVDTSNSGFTQVTLASAISGTGRASHRFAASGLIKAAGTGSANLRIQLNSAVTANTIQLNAGVNGSTTPGWQKFYVEGTAPSDLTNIQVYLISGGSTTTDFQIAQLGLWDLTASGL